MPGDVLGRLEDLLGSSDKIKATEGRLQNGCSKLSSMLGETAGLISQKFVTESSLTLKFVKSCLNKVVELSTNSFRRWSVLNL